MDFTAFGQALAELQARRAAKKEFEYFNNQAVAGHGNPQRTSVGSILGGMVPQREVPVAAPALAGGFTGSSVLAPPVVAQPPTTGVPFGGHVAPLIPGLVAEGPRRKAFRANGKVWNTPTPAPALGQAPIDFSAWKPNFGF